MRRSPETLSLRGNERKRKLVDAAYEIIAKRGFEGFRTRAVADEAGVNIATLHYYFPTKEDLVRGVAERLRNEFETYVEPELDATELSNPQAALRKEFADLVYGVRVHPETYVVLMELYTRSLRDPKIRAIIRDLILQWENHLRSFLSGEAARAAFPRMRDSKTTTMLLQCMLIGSATNLLLSDLDYPVFEIHDELASQLGADTTGENPIQE